MLEREYPSGTQVRIVQQIERRGYITEAEVNGTVEYWEDKPTGSWFAHGKDDKLWLKRLKLKKADGELVLLVIDEQTLIEKIETQATASS